MRSSILKVELYNDYWIDCRANNLLGVIKSQNYYNESKVFTLMEFNYFCSTPSASVTAEDKQGHYESGGGLLGARSDSSYLHSLFKKASIDYKEYSNLHHAIQEAITDGKYVFISVDTSFFPSDIRPKIHPTFIYGFDDNKKVYYVIDDLIRVGLLSMHEIPYSCMETAFYSVEHKQITSFQLLKDIEMTQNDYVEHVKKGLECSMYSIVKGEYWLLNYGLNSILIAAERLEFTIPQINCELISEPYWNITKPFKAPVILEERNILLVSELKNNDVILQSEYEYFKNGFTESKNSIEIYRIKLMKKIISNSINSLKEHDYDFLRNALHNVYKINNQLNGELIKKISS